MPLGGCNIMLRFCYMSMTSVECHANVMNMSINLTSLGTC